MVVEVLQTTIVEVVPVVPVEVETGPVDTVTVAGVPLELMVLVMMAVIFRVVIYYLGLKVVLMGLMLGVPPVFPMVVMAMEKVVMLILIKSMVPAEAVTAEAVVLEKAEAEAEAM